VSNRPRFGHVLSPTWETRVRVCGSGSSRLFIPLPIIGFFMHGCCFCCCCCFFCGCGFCCLKSVALADGYRVLKGTGFIFWSIVFEKSFAVSGRFSRLFLALCICFLHHQNANREAMVERQEQVPVVSNNDVCVCVCVVFKKETFKPIRSIFARFTQKRHLR
jgi:hypothetical protein